MNTIGIRPAQCVTPPPSLTIELLQVQPLAAQAASAQQLLLREIIIEICVQSAECLAAAKQCMLGRPKLDSYQAPIPNLASYTKCIPGLANQRLGVPNP